jgi:type I restriction-modification system DNA methylase subunit
MKPIDVKITRAEKRGRRIIVVFESDLYSDEVFAVTPFYDEGDAKNQLQCIRFDLNITEQSGQVKAQVGFANSLSHFTKGHSQLHYPINTFFLDKKDCARNWFLTEKQEYFTDERIDQILKLWEADPKFHEELIDITRRRRHSFRVDRLNTAKLRHQKALLELEEAMSELLP